jgi:hypothetical protein
VAKDDGSRRPGRWHHVSAVRGGGARDGAASSCGTAGGASWKGHGPPAGAAYRAAYGVPASRPSLRGVGIASRGGRARRGMKVLVSHRLSSPIRIAHPPAGGRGDGIRRLAPEWAAVIGRHEAPQAVLLGRGPRRPEAAARHGGPRPAAGWPVVHRGRSTAAGAGSVSRASYGSHSSSASRSGLVIATSTCALAADE